MQNKIESLPKAYEGNEPYIFISYRHLDKDKVFPVIKKLQDEFYRVWYDDGIKPGTDWNNYIESHLRNCQVFIAFFSKNYFQSEYCIKELEIARDCGKNFTYINLDEDLDSDSLYKYFFNNKNLKVTQGILNKDLNNNETDVYKKLLEFDLLGECRNAVQYDKIEQVFFDENKEFHAIAWKNKIATVIRGNKICNEVETDKIDDLTNSLNDDEKDFYLIYSVKKYRFELSENEFVDYEDAHKFSEGLASVKRNNRWGFITTDLSLVKGYTYNDAYSFKNGYCVVADKYGAYGVIDKNFKYIIDAKYSIDDKKIQEYLYDDDWTFNEALIETLIEDGAIDNKASYEKDAIVSVPKLKIIESMGYYTDKEGKKNYIKVNIKGKKLLVDASNNDFLMSLYSRNSDSGDLADNNSLDIENVDNKVSIFNEPIDSSFENLEIFDDEQNEIFGTKNYNIDDDKFDEIHEFKKWFIVKKNGKYSFLDKDGKQITDFIFDEYYEASFNDKLYFGEQIFKDASCDDNLHKYVKIDSQWGLIDDSGIFIIEPRFDGIWTLNPNGPNKCVGFDYQKKVEDHYEVCVGIIDYNGKIIIESTYYDNIWQINNYKRTIKNLALNSNSYIVLAVKNQNNPIYIVENNDGKKDLYINDRMRQVFRFDDIGEYYEDLCKVKFEDKWGYVDLNGEVVIEEKYDTATDFFYGCAIVSIANRYGVIDKTGKEIIKLQFNDATFDYDGNGGGLGVFIKVLLGTKEGYILNPGYNIKSN